MAKFSNVTITRAGRSHFAAAMSAGSSIEFSHIEVGNGQPPAAPEDLTSLVGPLSRVSISKTDHVDGVVTVRGTFVASGVTGNFYLREIGVFVKPFQNGGEPVLFAYANAGELADYFPDAGSNTVMEEVLTVSIVIGNAPVIFQAFDPNARATLQDMADLEDKLDIETIRINIEGLGKETENISKAIEEAKAGFVSKTGDKMTGNLEAPNFIGHLNGSADQFCGWRFFTGLEELNNYAKSDLHESSMTIPSIIEKMPELSRLIHVMSHGNQNLPAETGILEIQKLRGTLVQAMFTSYDGRMWRGGMYSGTWTGWGGTDGVPTGSLSYYAGPVAPVGWIFCQGQAVSRVIYGVLFSVIGTSCGDGDGSTTFNLPDCRGCFIRGLDDGAGIDSGRLLGSLQQQGLPNIKGTTGSYTFEAGALSGGYQGAFRTGNGANGVWSCRKDNGYAVPLSFDASKSNSIYGAADEVRPTNIAFPVMIKY